MKNNRKDICSNIIADLSSLKEKGSYDKYAINENIIFLQAVKNGIFSYIKWFFTRARFLDKYRILEITDFPMDKWDRMMHIKLIEMESKKFPGLVEPLVNSIKKYIITSDRPLLLANFGSGGMEIERQLADYLISINYPKKVVFIGFDLSKSTKEVGLENLSRVSKNCDIYNIEKIDEDFVTKLISNSSNNIAIVLVSNNIFDLPEVFKNRKFDLVYHSLFRHHLNKEQKEKLDVVIPKITNNLLEYDGFRDLKQCIAQTVVGWNNPVFLNAEIFSNLRYEYKNDLIKRGEGSKIIFTKIGNYLLDKKFI